MIYSSNSSTNSCQVVPYFVFYLGQYRLLSMEFTLSSTHSCLIIKDPLLSNKVLSALNIFNKLKKMIDLKGKTCVFLSLQMQKWRRNFFFRSTRIYVCFLNGATMILFNIIDDIQMQTKKNNYDKAVFRIRIRTVPHVLPSPDPG